MGKVVIQTPPTEEPITTAEAKAHLNLDSDFTADDTLIDAMITASREYAEAYCRRKFVTTTIIEYFDGFPSGALELSYTVQSLTSVKYKDSDNTEQTWTASDYITDDKAIPASLNVAPNKSYPSTYDATNVVYVEYVTGYGAASAVPNAIKQGLLLMLSDMYDNRMDRVRELPTTSQFLFNPYQIVQL